MPDADVRVVDDAAALAVAAGDAIAVALGRALAERGTAAWLCSGGSTPRGVYAHLARAHHRDVPWKRLDVFWGDERFLPREDRARNDVMTREALLDVVAIDRARIHPMPAAGGMALGTPDRSSATADRDTPDAEADDAARAYERELRGHLGDRPFDVVLLGLGEDGHTASLFPGSPALVERERWVVPAIAPVAPRRRLTCTFPRLWNARAIHVLVAGAAKGPALRRVFGREAVETCPAAALLDAPVPVTWWTDHAADAARRARNGR